jgi:hypothetical protein
VANHTNLACCPSLFGEFAPRRQIVGQLADAARESRPNLNKLFITGFAENALLNNGQLEPGMSVMTKPLAVPPGRLLRCSGMFTPLKSKTL